MDVLEIDAASNRGIDEIRALRDAVKFAPSSMRNKVYIIDEAHMLTDQGANAFLKTLEEPPPYVVFILATTAPEKLPATILSRCQRYGFRRIAIPVMIARMAEVAKGEKIEIDDEALSAIAYRADGGLRDALTMLEQAAAFAEGAISAQIIDVAFGTTGRGSARALLDAIIARDAALMLRTIDEASDSGTDMQVLNRTLIAELRNLLVARIDPELLTRDLAPEDAQAALSRAAAVPQAELIAALRLLSEALATARTSGHPRLELESALLRFMLTDQDATMQTLNARVMALENGVPPAAPQTPAAAAPSRSRAPKAADPSAVLAAQAVPAPQSPPEKTLDRPPGGALSLQKIRASWNNVRARIESERMPLRAPLSRALVDAFEDNRLTIKLPSDFEADILRGEQPLIEHAIADVLGEPIKVIFRTDGGGSGRASRSGTPPAAGDDPTDLLQYATERIQ